MNDINIWSMADLKAIINDSRNALGILRCLTYYWALKINGRNIYTMYYM